jgi:hypothetical protein
MNYKTFKLFLITFLLLSFFIGCNSKKPETKVNKDSTDNKVKPLVKKPVEKFIIVNRTKQDLTIREKEGKLNTIIKKTAFSIDNKLLNNKFEIKLYDPTVKESFLLIDKEKKNVSIPDMNGRSYSVKLSPFFFNDTANKSQAVGGIDVGEDIALNNTFFIVDQASPFVDGQVIIDNNNNQPKDFNILLGDYSTFSLQVSEKVTSILINGDKGKVYTYDYSQLIFPLILKDSKPAEAIDCYSINDVTGDMDHVGLLISR